MQFSKNLEKAILIAKAIAKEYMHNSYSAAHLLKALLHKDVELDPLLVQADIDVYYLADWADVRIEAHRKSTTLKEDTPPEDDVELVLEDADNIRLQLLDDELTPLHVLASIATPGIAFSFDQLKTFPTQREQIIQLASVPGNRAALLKEVQDGGEPNTGSGSKQILQKYCIDKTLMAAQGKLDPIIGREQEIRMMAEILSRRTKPNVLLIGEPGVGKTALVDGFALAIQNGAVPAFLKNAKVFELNNGAMAAGASYKGETEERLKSVINEIKTFDKGILFIDEIHVLLDKNGPFAGAANLLKPELAKGAITIIGATTIDEYRKNFERDEAFARRFETLTVEEPSPGVAFRMMKIVMPLYEAHHKIEVSDETLHESIRLAKRYIKDRRLPDAAIDLADRSMAALRLVTDTGTSSLESQKTDYDTLKSNTEAPTELTDYQWHYQQLKNGMSPVIWSSVPTSENPMEMKSPDEIISYLDSVYETLKPLVAENRTTLDKNDVVSIVADKTGIPLGKIQAREKERLLNIEEILKQRVVGQDHAIKIISESILESRSGLGKAGQPIGSFFFLGPTGTGKTELAKALADFLFQDETNIIRFDMSEFKEEHSAALLYGAPPGYVGYEEGGLLVNKIRQQPYSVVLFDEIEKAHQSVFDIFLQLMDEGKLHDKLGKEGDFSNSLVIFTSNIGSQHVVDTFNKGEVPDPVNLLNIMSNHFRPEFLGRLTEIVPFAPMKEEMVQRILDINLKSLYTTLEKQQVSVEVSPEAKAKLAKMGFTPQYGARPLHGVIRSEIRRPLSKKIIAGELQPGSKLKLDLKDEELVWASAES